MINSKIAPKTIIYKNVRIISILQDKNIILIKITGIIYNFIFLYALSL